jgi:hypothetical protein
VVGPKGICYIDSVRKKAMKQTKLFSEAQYKMAKSEGHGYAPVIMHLQPYKFMGRNTCPNAAGCAKVCLQYSGHMVFSNSINARQKRTELFWNDRPAFIAQLKEEITGHVRRAKRNGLIPAVRLNGTSDIVWERIAPELFTEFPEVQFYDYTKLDKRFNHVLPSNYHLTFSQSENNQEVAEQLIARGVNVAVVFRMRKGELPATYKGAKVIDGDLHDLRFMDQKGVVIGLRAKGNSMKDDSGFIVEVAA